MRLFSQQSSVQCWKGIRFYDRPGYGQQHGMRIAHHAVRELAAPILFGALLLSDPNVRAMLRNKKDS